MTMRKRKWKSVKAKSLSGAIELCIEYAAEQRRPIKVLADLMGVEIKTLYRWIAENSMPLNRMRQFEEFCGAHFISEYLVMAQGNKLVVEIPVGKKAKVTDLAELQSNFSEAITLLSRFYQSGCDVEQTINSLNLTLSQIAFQRNNVIKSSEPEFEFFGD